VSLWPGIPPLSAAVLLLELLLVLSALGALVELVSTSLVLRGAKRAARAAGRGCDPAGVTVLKPLCGLDDRLEDNLETFFLQDHSRFEIIFCLQSADDPALPVAQRVSDRHRDVECRFVVADADAGLNPKVNNLLAGYETALHPLVLISDSNVSVTPGYLREAVSHFADPRVALVSHLVRGVGARSPGALLDNGHLNTYILGAVCAAALLLRRPLVIGKSMTMRKSALDAAGGLLAVKDYLAEDFRLGVLLHRRGHRVVLSGRPVDTVNTRRTVREFMRRHVRWNRMRVSIAGPAYLFELLGMPLLLAAALAALGGGRLGPLGVVGAALALRCSFDGGMTLLLDERPVPWRQVALAPLRDLLVALIWVLAPLSRRVSWRGNHLLLYRGSRLVDPRPVEHRPRAAPQVGLAEE
jgi:ceramide glucosyltransferase